MRLHRAAVIALFIAPALSLVHGSALVSAQESLGTYEDRIAVALEHLRLQVAYVAEVDTYEDALALPGAQFQEAEMHAVRSLRGQIPLYIKGEPGAAQAREKLTRCSTYSEMEDELRSFQERLLVATA